MIESLGLEVAINKTRFVDFNKDDFKFVGFDFKHWRKKKNSDYKYFMIEPTAESFKDFKKKIKDATRKTLTLSQEEWIKKVNPIIRGKVNYYSIPYKAVEKNKEYGQESHCYLKSFSKELHKIDAYTRQRLRVCMIHKHPTVRKGMARKLKWNVEYFCRIKLIPAGWLYYDNMWGYPIEKYIEKQTGKNKRNKQRYIEKLKAKGIEYYTKERLEIIAYSKGLAIT